MKVQAMNRNVLSMVLLLGGATTLVGCHQGNAQSPPAAASDAPEVSAVLARAAEGGYELRLPARAVAGESARVHARATGFVRERLVDLGDRVEAGQILARIAAPEIDQTVREAEAGLLQARTDLELAKVNYDRAASLVETGAISRELYNERSASREVGEAALAAAQARLANARERQAFQTVRAPFAGVIAARSIERGDRVVGDSAATAVPLFAINALDPLRVLVDVPQNAALQVQPGMMAEVVFPELPGEVLAAEVVRSARAIAEDVGGMRVELRLPNPDERIPAGMVGTVRLQLGRPVPAVVVPVAAVVREGSGEPRIARIDAGEVLSYQPVTLGRNLGNDIEVLSGIVAGDTVVLAPNALLVDGSRVRVRGERPPG